jgi:glycosyltransferase involved in cell wall biosynthesis
MAVAYIHETSESVFWQTYHNFEVILIDDDSSDTEDFERAIAPYRDRLIYIRQQMLGRVQLAIRAYVEHEASTWRLLIAMTSGIQPVWSRWLNWHSRSSHRAITFIPTY